MKYHTTKDGKKIKITELELSHLENIIKWIERKAKTGISVIIGLSGSTADEMWADEIIYFGKKAKEKLNYFAYKNELKRRHIANNKFLCALSDEKRCKNQCYTCSEDEKCDILTLNQKTNNE